MSHKRSLLPTECMDSGFTINERKQKRQNYGDILLWFNKANEDQNAKLAIAIDPSNGDTHL